ncbi:MAG: ligase-associated DNA damage response exonuclease [Cyanobacteria bacterium J06638_22]
MASALARWIETRPEGLYIKPGDFFIDPLKPVNRAVISHGHSDHARPNHHHVLATIETLAIMKSRLGEGAGQVHQPTPLGVTTRIGDVRVRLEPAGHVLGSAQIVLEYAGNRIVYSGDYKRAVDPTCIGFEPILCDVFITEATFGLPVFRHPKATDEINKLLHSHGLFPDRCHVVGCYSLGKAQRVVALLRQAGYDRPIYIHGALHALCDLYEKHGIALGKLLPATAGPKGIPRNAFRGEIVIAPPSAIADRWARRLPDPVVAMASGWMRVKQRARQRGVELPLIISDHADWDELLATLDDVDAPEVWVTHGREEALVHAAVAKGIDAKALTLIGYDEAEN